MTDTTSTDPGAPAARSVQDQQLADELVERARSEGVELVGPGGLLAGLTKNVLRSVARGGDG